MESNSSGASFGRPADLNGAVVKSGAPRRLFLSTIPKAFLKNTAEPLKAFKQVKITKESALHCGYFLLKVAALEIIRNAAQKKIPILWTAIQGIGLLGLPPFVWLQRWSLFKHITKLSQGLSKPLLFLSFANTCLSQSKDHKDSVNEHSNPFTNVNSLQTEAVENIHVEKEEGTGSQKVVNQQMSVKVLKETIEKEDIIIPERLNDDEINRFSIAANGDPAQFLSRVKKTIVWRERYRFLSSQELENWSQLVLWHGQDVHLRPCLFIHIGLACSSLKLEDRPRFAQAVVSQVEYGITHLLNLEDPRVTVLMNCDGVPATGFPIQMMKYCSILLQEHYPTRLASLFVANLPPMLRGLAHNIIQVLKPVTQEKLQILGDDYKKVLSEVLESVPSILAGDCTCSHCRKMSARIDGNGKAAEKEISHSESQSDDEMLCEDAGAAYSKCIYVLRGIILVFLMIWILFAALGNGDDS